MDVATPFLPPGAGTPKYVVGRKGPFFGKFAPDLGRIGECTRSRDVGSCGVMAAFHPISRVSIPADSSMTLV